MIVAAGEGTTKSREVVGNSLEIIVEVIGPVLFLGVTLNYSFDKSEIFKSDDVISGSPRIDSAVADSHSIASAVVRDSVLDGGLPLSDQVGQIALL